MTVNCAALPETLLESELFGHERGAFTGADRAARRAASSRPTAARCFLDEIGEMPPADAGRSSCACSRTASSTASAATRALAVDVRVVAATNRDLERAVRAGGFREDLYYRLNVIRDRSCRRCASAAADIARRSPTTSSSSSRATSAARAPASRAAALARAPRATPGPATCASSATSSSAPCCSRDGDEIRAEHVGLAPRAAPGWQPELPAGGLALEEVERAVVLEALRRARFVQKDAAALLRVSRRKLNYMIRRMGITHPSWRRNRNDAAPAPGRAESGSLRPFGGPPSTSARSAPPSS